MTENEQKSQEQNETVALPNSEAAPSIPDLFSGEDGAVNLDAAGTFAQDAAQTATQSVNDIHSATINIPGISPDENSLVSAVTTGVTGAFANIQDKFLEDVNAINATETTEVSQVRVDQESVAQPVSGAESDSDPVSETVSEPKPALETEVSVTSTTETPLETSAEAVVDTAPDTTESEVPSTSLEEGVLPTDFQVGLIDDSIENKVDANTELDQSTISPVSDKVDGLEVIAQQPKPLRNRRLKKVVVEAEPEVETVETKKVKKPEKPKIEKARINKSEVKKVDVVANENVNAETNTSKPAVEAKETSSKQKTKPKRTEFIAQSHSKEKASTEFEVEQKYENGIEPGYETLRGVTPLLFHSLIDKAEVWSASKKADTLSVSLAAAEGAVELNKVEFNALTNQINDISEKIAAVAKDSSLSAAKKGTLTSKLEGQKGAATLKLEAVGQRLSQASSLYSGRRAEATKYENRRNEVVDRVKAKFEEKAAPHREKVEILKDQESNLSSEILQRYETIKGFKSQLNLLKGSNHERRTKRALEKEIAKNENILIKRMNDLDKIKSKLIPISGMVSRLDISRDKYDPLKNNRTENSEKSLLAEQKVEDAAGKVASVAEISKPEHKPRSYSEEYENNESLSNFERLAFDKLDLMDMETEFAAEKTEAKINHKKGLGFFGRIFASLMMALPGVGLLTSGSNSAPKPMEGPIVRHVAPSGNKGVKPKGTSKKISVRHDPSETYLA